MNGADQGGGFGWSIIAIGLVIAGAGLLWILVPGISRLGRLPGDIVLEGKNSRFYFPIVSCILVSIVLSVAMWLFGRFTGGGN